MSKAHVLELARDHVERSADGVRVAGDGHDALRARAVRDVDARRALHTHRCAYFRLRVQLLLSKEQ